jgi:hypothetical protein
MAQRRHLPAEILIFFIFRISVPIKRVSLPANCLMALPLVGAALPHF